MDKNNIKKIITTAMKNALQHIPLDERLPESSDWRLCCHAPLCEIMYPHNFDEGFYLKTSVTVVVSFEKWEARVLLNWPSCGQLEAITAVASATQHLELAHKAARVQVILQHMLSRLRGQGTTEDYEAILAELHEEAVEEMKAAAILEEAYRKDG
jgi:hypothetical protein